MELAVANKNLPALHYMALKYGEDGRYADSVGLYQQVLALDAYDMNAQLEMYLMRIRAGQPEHAKSGLEQAMANFKWPPWPAPITQYYLGKMSLTDLPSEANSESDLAKRRQCEAYRYASALQTALGQSGQDKDLSDKGLIVLIGSKIQSRIIAACKTVTVILYFHFHIKCENIINFRHIH